MKVLLHVGEAVFEAADAATAAKVADLLGGMTRWHPESFWDGNTRHAALVKEGFSYRHAISIAEVEPATRRFDTRAEFEAWEAETKAAAKEGGES